MTRAGFRLEVVVAHGKLEVRWGSGACEVVAVALQVA